MNLIIYHLSKQNIFKKSLIVKLFLLVAFCFSCISIHAQDVDDLDSLLIDRDIENYSIRIFSNYKVNKFSIKDDNSKVKFVPNNRYGIGVAYLQNLLLKVNKKTQSHLACTNS